MAKRLTQNQKDEIVQSFKEGIKINFLSKKFQCTDITIIRNLEKSLGKKKYKELIDKNKKVNSLIKSDCSKLSFESSLEEESLNKDSYGLGRASFKNEIDFIPEDSFLEILPINYEIENSSRREFTSVSISEINFPKVVYMIVDKKIELEIKLLKDFPEWEFLPDDDLNRKTIEIFFDLNLAKRSCNKDQKVLKVPNTDVFRIAAPLLTAKGISRIVCAENLIAL